MLTIEIFGTGCAKCNRLEKNVQKAVKEIGIRADVKKVEDINEIINRGILMTPALFINGKAKTRGKVPSVEDIKEMLRV